jgi:hypothetical protein
MEFDRDYSLILSHVRNDKKNQKKERKRRTEGRGGEINIGCVIIKE